MTELASIIAPVAQCNFHFCIYAAFAPCCCRRQRFSGRKSASPRRANILCMVWSTSALGSSHRN
jgi:hypothetical protein